MAEAIKLIAGIRALPVPVVELFMETDIGSDISGLTWKCVVGLMVSLPLMCA